ncbi:MAG: lysylphosphatidylglycerol synthase domain-containing protein [Ginsengibacter sp.]
MIFVVLPNGRLFLLGLLSISIKLTERIRAQSYMILRNKNIKRIFKYIIAPVLGIWLFYSLYQQIQSQPDLDQSLAVIKDAPFGAQAWKFWSVILMVFINWGLEARKWQILIHPIQKMNYTTAYKSVLTGVTLSINTPNRIGEYGGRILYVKDGSRIKAVSVYIAGSISQLIITLIMGCLGLLYLLNYQMKPDDTIMGLSYFWVETLLILSIFIGMLMILFFFRLSWLVKLVEKIPAMEKYVHYINVLEAFNPKLLLRLLSLSLFRYITFVLQYILLLQVLNVPILWFEGFPIISILFLVMAVIPSFAIADLGIRGKFSTALLGIYSSNQVGIIGTTFGIWFINLFIPALLGSILILSIKFFNEK